MQYKKVYKHAGFQLLGALSQTTICTLLLAPALFSNNAFEINWVLK